MNTLFRRLLGTRLDVEMKQLLRSAETLARSFSHDYVGVEHAFRSVRGLAPSHSALEMIARLPIDIPSFWRDLENEAKVVTGRPIPLDLPYTPRLQHTLRLDHRLAKDRKKDEVTISHFIGAVAIENASLVAQVYRRHLQAKGHMCTFQDAAAQYFNLLMSAPQVLMFEAPLTQK